MKFLQRGECRGGMTWKPFLDMKKQLMDSPCPLTIFHQRLIVDDFMLLGEPGESLICLLSSRHYYILNSTVKFRSKLMANHWVATRKCALATLPYKPFVLSGVTYFPFHINVHSNP